MNVSHFVSHSAGFLLCACTDEPSAIFVEGALRSPLAPLLFFGEQRMLLLLRCAVACQCQPGYLVSARFWNPRRAGSSVLACRHPGLRCGIVGAMLPRCFVCAGLGSRVSFLLGRPSAAAASRPGVAGVVRAWRMESSARSAASWARRPWRAFGRVDGSYASEGDAVHGRLIGPF